MPLPDAKHGLADALTLRESHFYACANPFCGREARRLRSHGRYCSPRCRMDGYVLRRAKVMIDQVGETEFISRVRSVS